MMSIWNGVRARMSLLPDWCAGASTMFVLALLCSVMVGCETPQTCLVDDDCPLKVERCRQNQCLKPASCEKDSDCKYKGEVCRDKLCTDNSNPPPGYCPTTCFSNDECKDCKNGRTSCVSGACVTDERAAPYTRCGSGIGKACESGTVCSGASAASQYCLPECNPSQKRCPDGQSTCVDARGTGKGLCIPDGLANEGDACVPQLTGDPKIDTKQFCRAELFCDTNTCKKPQVVGKYKACRTGSICDSSMTCVLLSQTASGGYCLPSCDTQQASCDGGKGVCHQTTSGKGVCLPKGTGKSDQRCGATGDSLKPEHFCEGEFRCVGLSNGSLCLKVVPECTSNTCAPGRLCLPVGSAGACVISCQHGSNGCPNGLQCRHLHSGAQHLDICAP